MVEVKAWLYEHENGRREVYTTRGMLDGFAGWTETPLYGPEALAAKDARIEQLEADVARLGLLLAEALQAMNLEGVCEPNCMACGDILAALKETKHD